MVDSMIIIRWLAQNHKYDVRLFVNGVSYGMWFWDGVKETHEKISLITLRELFDNIPDIHALTESMKRVDATYEDFT